MTTRRILRSALVIGVFVLLQGTLALDINFSGVHPDLIVGLVLSAGLIGGTEVGMVTGFVAGMAIDLVSPTPLGLSALVFSVFGFVAGTLSDRFGQGVWWFRALVVMVGSALGELSYGILGAVIGEPQFIHVDLLGIMVVVSLINVVVCGAFFRLERWALRTRQSSAGLVSAMGEW
jgi:rod shape-determining protein MreD